MLNASATQRILLCLLFTLGWAAEGTQGAETSAPITQIHLRSTVRLQSGNHPLTLGEIATITGPQSIAIQSLEITTKDPIKVGAWSTIERDQIQQILEDADSIHTGSLILAGHDVSITRRAQPIRSTPQLQQDSKSPIQPGPVLKDHLQSWVYAHLKTDAQSTRIQYNERDAALLSTPTTGRIIEISSNGRSEKMSVRIVIYENERIMEDTTLRFDVQIQRRVRIVTTQLKRRGMIDETNSRIDSRWLAPTIPIADPDASLGQVSKGTINSGSILINAMLQSPIIVERGEIVSARSLAGTVSVAMKVRALEDGRMGDLIKLESRDRKQRFTARIAGRAQVIIVQHPQDPSKSPSKRDDS